VNIAWARISALAFNDLGRDWVSGLADLCGAVLTTAIDGHDADARGLTLLHHIQGSEIVRMNGTVGSITDIRRQFRDK
jgi:hypothetical protein